MTALRARAAFVVALFLAAFVSFIAVATHSSRSIPVAVATIH